MKDIRKERSFGKGFPYSVDNGKRSVSLTLEEQEQFLDVIETFEDLALFKLELNTGIRREDITNIEIGNVDLENRKIRFWEQKKRRWYEVPISKTVMPDLIRYMNMIPKSQKKLFTFTGRTAYNKLQYYLKKSNIKKHLAFHDLRHTFVKTAKKKGLSIKAVAQILGDRVSTVEEWYANLDMEELKGEADKL